MQWYEGGKGWENEEEVVIVSLVISSKNTTAESIWIFQFYSHSDIIFPHFSTNNKVLLRIY